MLAEMQRHLERNNWSTKARDDMASHAFRIRGQAVTLGYNILAQASLSLGNYCEAYLAQDEHRAVIVAKHLEVMSSLLEDDQAQGGETGKLLLQHLQLLVDKYHPESA